MSKCLVCGKPDDEKPMAYQKEEWCSDWHRKVVLGEVRPNDKEWASMEPTLYERLWMKWGNQQ